MTELSKNAETQQSCETAVSSSTLLDFIVEFTAHWSDGCVDYEQTINIKAENKLEAEKIGKEKLLEMDETDNRFCYCVSRRYYRTVLEENFSYNSSAKEDSGIYRDAGYIDVVAFKHLL
jgi:hypothetical protein